jgi:hypothetical protein
MRSASLFRNEKFIIGCIFLACYFLFLFINKPVDHKSDLINQIVDFKESNYKNNRVQYDGGHADATSPTVLQEGSVVVSKESKPASILETQFPLQPVPLNVDSSTEKHAFFELDTIVQSEERPEYRLSAVNQLSSMLSRSDLDGQTRKNIIETLRIATTDGDERVAEVATEAYKRAAK